MAADASKVLVIVASLLLLVACSEQGSVLLSKRYRVCIVDSPGLVYANHKEWIDYDEGVLTFNKEIVNVEIGGHPRFSHKAKRTGNDAVSGFKLLGVERSDNRDKVLWGYNRGDRQGPVLVMLSSPQLGDLEKILTQEKLLVDCN
ncbi:hypothetical protein [Lysobacter sp. Root604]|uniref:hypothetical protein n=1 Tax=Lysobacter sp. Root604 TaxID=1736568 RepID=UPI0006FCB4C3|nr:hypothetical protein [Lysobacter sp. Root604]KRA16854.1 hypothetical protein ASD69_08870 [Lysobacter sp. Root604]